MQRLEKYPFKEFGNQPVSDLKNQDFKALYHRIEAEGHITTAHIVSQICNMVMDYAKLSGYVKENVANGLAGTLKKVPEKHHPCIMDPHKYGVLLNKLDAYDGEPSMRTAMSIMPYVFVRANELLQARWREIDFEKALWTIPAERMKNRRIHIVPLSRQVLGLLREIQKVNGNREMVFYSKRARKPPFCISDNGMNKVLTKALKELGFVGENEETTDIHGMRATASTFLNGELSFPRDWIEKQLSHVEGNAVRAAYNHAEYLNPDQRPRMMQVWADYLDKLKSEARSDRKPTGPADGNKQ